MDYGTRRLYMTLACSYGSVNRVNDFGHCVGSLLDRMEDYVLTRYVGVFATKITVGSVYPALETKSPRSSCLR